MKKTEPTPAIPKDSFVILVVITIIISAYYPVLNLGFFSDDYHIIHTVANNTQSLAEFFTTNLIGTNSGHSYGPIYKLLMLAQYKLFGLSAVGYHVFSVLLHMAVTTIVYLLTKRFAPRTIIPAATAILFAVMPVHVNAVTWVSVQPHLLATLGVLLAIYGYLTYQHTVHKRWYALSILATVFALLSKDTAITILPILICLELFKKQTKKEDIAAKIKKIGGRLLPFIGVTGIYMLLRAHATGSATASYTGGLTFDYIAMERMFLEMTTAIFFPALRIILSEFIQSGPFVVFPISLAVFGAILFCIRKKRKLLLLLAVYTVSTIPFLFVAFNHLTEEGNRYVYLSSTIAVILAVGIIHHLTNHLKQKRNVFALIILLACMVNIQAIGYRFTFWQEADTEVKQIISSPLIDKLDTNELHTMIALPDNVQGAQVMRNAIFQAIELERGVTLNGERIPQYTYRSANTPTQEIRITQEEGSVILHRNHAKQGYTGFKQWETNTGNYAMTKPNKWGSTGNKLQITPTSLEAIIYPSNGQLTRYEVK